MVWIYGGEGASHKIWSGSMQWFLRNLTLQTDDGQTTDDERLHHDSSQAELKNHKLKISKIENSTFVMITEMKFQEKFENFRLRFVGGVAF